MLLTTSVITMILALLCYTIGVWREKLSRSLNKKNITFFWIGFVFDTTGTTLMSLMSEKFKLDFKKYNRWIGF